MKAVVLIVFLAMAVFAQANEDSLYARGLQACLEKEIASYKSFSERDLRNVIVAYDFYITRNLPKKMGEISVRYLDDSELIQEFRKLSKEERKRGVPYIKIFPISDREEKLYFAYNTRWFRYSEKGGFFSERRLIHTHGLEGGCNAEIAFDPSEKKFYISEASLWGI
ncbi:MAG: hypothetical protein IPM21_08095 [Acidobacteria bacterium]|nr:hypothetical protein [Acidobacteriota bacterium]